MSKFKKKILFSFFFIILIIFFLEILLRILKIEYPIFQTYDPVRGFSLLPNSSGIWRREGEGIVKINSYGLRDIEHEISKSKNTLRIAILGDSFAEARSINMEDTFWYKLKRNLENCDNFHKGKNIEVINFGVTEYGTTQQYLTLKNNVWEYNPDLVLLAFYSGNDISDNLRALSTKKYRPYFSFDENNSIIIDKSYLNSKPYKILSSIPGQIFIRISQYSRISQLFREAYVQMYFKRKREEKTVSTKNIPKINNNLYNPANSIWNEAWIVTEKIIKKMNNDVSRKSKNFILVSLSTPEQVNPNQDDVRKFKKRNNINNLFYPEDRLKQLSKNNSIMYIPLAKKMSEIATNENIFFHGFKNSKFGTGHWNETGHNQASKLISEGICSYF